MREAWRQMREAYDGDLDALWGDRHAQRAIWQAHDPHHLAEHLRHTPVYLSTGDGNPGPLDPPDSPYDPAEAVIRAHAAGLRGWPALRARSGRLPW